ncbi:MAG: hypothetical protein JWM35_1769 [Verrucomicrobia bacterium]|nr:hypothetical protein [Verrucomicrobiota bacterium]
MLTPSLSSKVAALFFRRTLRWAVRRVVLAALAGTSAVSGRAVESFATAVGPAPGIRRELFIPSPKPGTAVSLSTTDYARATGLELVSLHGYLTRSDTVDAAYFRRSFDNGRTWSEPAEVRTSERREGGMFRRVLLGGSADPQTGRFVRFRNEGVLPTDNPIEGMRHWYVCYTVSEDGERTSVVDEQIIQRGAEFSATHPLPGVWVGRNCMMMGELSATPHTLADGTLLIPVCITPVGPDGNYFNPGGGLSYFDVGVLRGRWRSDKHIDWELSSVVKADPALSTRGMDEATLAVLTDGRVLMVMRGSNDKKPALPGRRWVSYSSDGARTWTAPVPWTFAGGEKFFSPAACSKLVMHSSGRIFWIGNITPDNPTGNSPRYPLVIGEVDGTTGLLRKGTLRIVDDRRPGESESLQLSNFAAREDRETGEIVVTLSRLFERTKGPTRDWTSDAYLYHIPVK